MLLHGGNLTNAAAQYGIPEAQWLDLSTGLNPEPWQLTQAVPTHYLTRLPYPDTELLNAATSYYGTDRLLPVPGSQAVIQLIPQLHAPCTVAIPVPGYEEHHYHWQKNGHRIVPYHPDHDDLITLIQREQPNVLLVINPNNPSGRLYSQQELLTALRAMEKQGGTLLIDEAFIDTRPQHSLAAVESDALLILRSLGKFFGLPGIRAGFVIANQVWRNRIESALGPWALSGPSQWIATQCLSDKTWQYQAIEALQSQSAQQAAFLMEYFADPVYQPIRATDYFITLPLPSTIADSIQHHFGQQGILLRKITLDANHSLIRIGLAAPDAAYKRLQQVTKGLIPHGVLI